MNEDREAHLSWHGKVEQEARRVFGDGAVDGFSRRAEDWQRHRASLIAEPSYSIDPDDKADRLRAAAHMALNAGVLPGSGHCAEVDHLLEAAEEAAQELDNSVPRYWLYVVMAQSVALLGAAIAYSAPTCG